MTLHIASQWCARPGHAEGRSPVKSYSYRERDYAFGQLILTLRTRIGLTQEGLGERLGVSRRAVAHWEAGLNYPDIEHLQALIALGVQQRIFPAGQEAEEIRALWRAAHQKVLLDEAWLASVLGRTRPALTLLHPELQEAARPGELPRAQPTPAPLLDWGEALSVPSFYGRDSDLATLLGWVVEERCHLVSVLGLGGIGKSALVVRTMREVASHFEVVLFRSLRDAPSYEALLSSCLAVLSPEPQDLVHEPLERRQNRLLEKLRSLRVLLVLDNLEVLLEEGEALGRLRPGYEGYGQLLEQVAHTDHQSCLLLTSREHPAALRALEGRRALVRSLRLSGLEASACAQLLGEHELVGAPEEYARLAERYAGNPLALSIVAETIADLFGGAISPFLSAGTILFGSITQLLQEQWERLSALEKMVLSWLAILREPVTLEELQAVLVAPLAPAQVLEAVDGLRRRSLVERGQRPGSFTLQSVVLEFVTDRLITTASQEIRQGQLALLREHGLSQAQAKDYVRQSQERMLVAPVLSRLESVIRGQAEVEGRLRELLSVVLSWAEGTQGYAPANLVTLLRVLRGHLRGLDLSRLVLRGVHLQGVEMQDASLAGATLRDTVFTEAFNAARSVAISRNGEHWAAGSWRGEVRVWQQGGQSLHLVWQAHTDTVSTLAFSEDERLLATGSWDGTIKVWDLERGPLSGEQVTLLWTSWQTESIQSLAFAPDGRMLASGGDGPIVRLWDATSGTNLQMLLGPPSPVYTVAWSPDGTQLASAGSDTLVTIWDVVGRGGGTQPRVLRGHRWNVRGVAWSPDGRLLASSGTGNAIELWDPTTGESRHILRDPDSSDTIFLGIAWSTDGQLLASGSHLHGVQVWDVAARIRRWVGRAHPTRIRRVAWSPDGTRLASGGDDGSVCLWEVSDGALLQRLQGHNGLVASVVWSPDGTRLASSGGGRGELFVWDAHSGERLQALSGHPGSVFAVDWSQLGDLLVSGGSDGMLRWWDVRHGECLMMREAHQGAVQSLRISSNGRMLATCGDDSTIQVWDLENGEHMRTLQRDRPYERPATQGGKG